MDRALDAGTSFVDAAGGSGGKNLQEGIGAGPGGEAPEGYAWGHDREGGRTRGPNGNAGSRVGDASYSPRSYFLITTSSGLLSRVAR